MKRGPSFYGKSNLENGVFFFIKKWRICQGCWVPVNLKIIIINFGTLWWPRGNIKWGQHKYIHEIIPGTNYLYQGYVELPIE